MSLSTLYFLSKIDFGKKITYNIYIESERRVSKRMLHIILPRFFINCERWKWNPDLRVYVSTHGHVKNQYKQNMPLKIGTGGYFRVQIEGKIYSVHRLVLLTWRPLPADGEPMTVDHLDSNKRNNRLDNLEWVSEQENLRRADNKLIRDSATCGKPKPKSKKPKKTPPPNLICGEQVTWDSLAKYGIAKEKITVKNSNEQDIQEQKAAFRKLFLDGTIVAFCGNKQMTPALVMGQGGIPPEVPKDKTIDRFLLRSIRCQDYFNKNSLLYWRLTDGQHND